MYNGPVYPSKSITAGKLIEVLKILPPEWEIWPSPVGDLAVGDAKAGVMKGFVDLAEEVWSPFCE